MWSQQRLKKPWAKAPSFSKSSSLDKYTSIRHLAINEKPFDLLEVILAACAQCVILKEFPG